MHWRGCGKASGQTWRALEVGEHRVGTRCGGGGGTGMHDTEFGEPRQALLEVGGVD